MSPLPGFVPSRISGKTPAGPAAMLPFTADVLFSSIAAYNRAIWPAPAVALALGLVALGLAMRPVSGGGRLIGAILAAAWLWAGIGFHLIHFSSINFAEIGRASCRERWCQSV